MRMTRMIRVAFCAGWHIGRLMKCCGAPPKKPTVTGGAIVYIVKADNPDVNYSINPPQVTDSEGNVVPAGELTFPIESDNPAAVEVIPDGPLSGKVHFGGPNADGSPASAAITARVIHNGNVIGVLGAQFTVTAGDPAAIAGGSLVFEGLVEV